MEKMLKGKKPEKVRIHMTDTNWVEYKLDQQIYCSSDVFIGAQVLGKYKSVIDYSDGSLYFTVNKKTYRTRL